MCGPVTILRKTYLHWSAPSRVQTVRVSHLCSSSGFLIRLKRTLRSWSRSRPFSGGLRCVPLWKIQHGGRPATPRCDPRPAATDMHASRSGRSAALRCMQQIMRFDSCFLTFEASSIFVLQCWTWCCGEASLQRESLPRLQMDGHQ